VEVDVDAECHFYLEAREEEEAKEEKSEDADHCALSDL
jgi:hypothetical protein